MIKKIKELILSGYLVLPIAIFMVTKDKIPQSFKSFLLENDPEFGFPRFILYLAGILYFGFFLYMMKWSFKNQENEKLKETETKKFYEDIYKHLHTANLSQNTFIFEFVFSGHSIALQMRNRVDGGTGISRWYNIASDQQIEEKSEKELFLKFLNKVTIGDFSEFSTDRKTNYSKTSNNYNPYEILGVDKSATNDQIRNVWRSLAKIYHPDTGNSPAKEKFTDYMSAYESIRKERNF
jgi:hypothetical protein